jgi:hypothetical protein
VDLSEQELQHPAHTTHIAFVKRTALWKLQRRATAACWKTNTATTQVCMKQQLLEHSGVQQALRALHTANVCGRRGIDTVCAGYHFYVRPDSLVRWRLVGVQVLMQLCQADRQVAISEVIPAAGVACVSRGDFKHARSAISG